MNQSRTVEGAFRFVVWAQTLKNFPSWQQIAARFDCSRATAYRYRNALAAAMGIEVPPNPSDDALADSHHVRMRRATCVINREPVHESDAAQ